jgi:hypothetical protein
MWQTGAEDFKRRANFANPFIVRTISAYGEATR